MKPTNLKTIRRVVVAICALILLFLLFELLFRGQVLRHSLASGAYNQGRYQQAGEIWQKLRDAKDGDHIPESSLGKSQYQAGNYGESETSQAEALKENDQASRLHYDRGNALYRGDKLDEALKAYRSAMLLDPDDQDAKANYELVLNLKGYKPPPPPPEEKPSPGQDQDQPDRQTEPEPQPEEEREKFRNQLDALDQQESRDRQAQKPQGKKGGADKWW
ncbi:MAG: tetratricopeptide repeat protein [Candidatus Cloacimonetes bacterium]|nr:tetratricopeptide repeat protein [Candidatus Cloacimonadota bacterium]